ncbi:MAG: D-amino acid aminotransferase [Clostridia bacterium]|nr:D-amino acid aminotransferase [Clostridia bacterium]
MSESLVYLNGQFVPYSQATVHVEDRGLLFADGVYEVIRVYGGRPFALDEHFERLERSASLMRLPLPKPVAELKAAALETLDRSGLKEATIYVEVTRGGGGPRNHAFPADPRPTVFMIAREAKTPSPALYENGARLVTVPDRRWHMCHVKSIGLFLNCLAKQEALEAGADDALFVRGAVVTEASSANFMAVWGGELRTHPESEWILPGITRRVVLDLAREAGIPVVERAFTLDELWSADEAFITGTTTEVLPVVQVDGRAIGDGRPGPVTRRLRELYASRARSS